MLSVQCVTRHLKSTQPFVIVIGGSTLDLNGILKSNTGMCLMLGSSVYQELKQTKGCDNCGG